MLLADRAEFVAHLKTLCAGYNIPCTPEREEAYWRGLEKLHLSQFARVVAHALGEKGPDKLPTVRDVWSLHRVLRRATAPEQSPPQQTEAFAVDACTAFANRALFTYLHMHGPTSDETLARMVTEKNRIAAQLREIASDNEFADDDRAMATHAREVLFRAFERVLAPMPWQQIEAHRERLCRTSCLQIMPRDESYYRRRSPESILPSRAA